ncbi:hypothetical protein EVG20_g8633 [Dentipellis fragilis]|uniref:LAA1-like C-terminal TPR repeats domain-containing protein n=1 Tax=Dentipellis fragilis TaxID=205917 RepID=A0A4Y9Y3Z4_9AGAM|nr:hypothetical protein EVG20_g8633 [Dentipellis fragilis]
MDQPIQFSLSDATIDESRLSGDDGEVYILQWLSSATHHLQLAPPEDVKHIQHGLETTFLKILTSGSPYPPPGRPLRNLVAQAFLILYNRGDSKTLFDTILALMKVVGDFKAGPDKDRPKIASLYCLGQLMESYGGQVMSFMAEIATATVKLHRSSNSIVVRYHAIVALRKSICNARRALTDAVAKDVIKQMKSALNDRSLPIRRAASEVLVALYPLAGQDWTPSEIESVVSLCIRSLDSADQVTRHSLAQLVAKVLSSSQIELPAPPVDNNKKTRKDEDVDNDPAPTIPPVGDLKTILSQAEMLVQLSSPFNKPHTSHRTRVGIFDFYSALLTMLGPSFVEANYNTIVNHFTTEMVMNPRNSATRYDILFLRRLMNIILRELIGVRMLSEQAQIGAIQELSNSYLKRWPALLHGQVAPGPLVLAVVLREVAGLLQQLGNAPPLVQDALAEPLVTLLEHPSHTVRVHACWALRVFCVSSPLRLPKITFNVLELLQRDIGLLTTQTTAADAGTRALGHAYGLAALITVVREKPLYVSYDISAKVLDMAIQLLKRAGDHDVQIAGIEVEVAWTCIASLMTLGPNFVRAHLPQLLVLWRNALPKPTSKDTSHGGGRTKSEWMFLTHLRESAMGAILCFLRHNSPTLVSLDVARRIASMLSNAFLFANALSSHHAEEPAAPGSETASDGPSLRTRENLLRRRIYQCFTVLGVSSVPESTQVALVQSVISLVASPDGFAGSTVQAAIASSSGSFVSLWQSFDGYAYGVTAKSVGEDSDSDDPILAKDRLNRDSIDASIDELLRKPVLQSCEYDTLAICQVQLSIPEEYWQECPPPATAAVDAALQLFSSLLPQQELPAASRLLSQLFESARSPKFDKNVGRKAAASVNATMALLLALRQVSVSSSRQARDVFGSPQITTTLSSFLKDALVDGDPVLRLASSEALGRLAGLADSVFLANQMKSLVDQVVNNRDPSGRAGCALALGAIFEHVGSLAAGPLLKTTVNILMSLSKDAHPMVHFWSLHSLSRVINAASLTYAPYVGATLGMLFNIYMLESHEPEGGSQANANAKGDLPAYQVVCRIIDSVITILGPDIQESTRTRSLILDLVRQFMNEEDEGIQVEAIKCIQHVLMFAPEHVPIPQLVDQFRTHLNSSRRPLKLASINALYQLVQKDALLVSKIGGDRLVEELFAMLDGDSSIEGVRKVILSWLHQTVVYNPSAWIDLCQKIMSRTNASQQAADASVKSGPGFDDEGESLNIGTSNDGSTSGPTRLTSRWRTQLFALQCLHDICNIVATSGRKEQLDLVLARKLGLSASNMLVSRVPDLIKMAFTASTAHVTEIRLEGLVVLRDVIEIFSKTPDPDYEDALLLEQYQAPVTAALTPAFTSDSTPEILASAIGACAIFVGCGIVKDVSRMGRILKLLTSALEQCKGSGMLSLGDAAEGSPNASAMLRIATLSAWAELACASVDQPYLKEVVNPYRGALASLWVAALRDYASIRIGSEVIQDTSSAPLDLAYASLGKDILIPYYVDAWPVILQAIAIAMEAQDPFIRGAIDGIEIRDGQSINGANSNSRKDPAALFFVIFGLVYEALSSMPESTSTGRNNLPLIALRTMRNIVRPEYAGQALLEPTIFDELLNLWYRMAMTESALVQVQLVETIAIFASTQNAQTGKTEQPSFSSPQGQCLRVCAFILKNAIPGSTGNFMHDDVAERTSLIKASFDAFLTIASLFSHEIQEEARAVAISLYSDLLKDETSENDYAGPTLPSLVALVSRSLDKVDTAFYQLIHGLLSACLLNIDEMKGRQGAISTRKTKNNLLAAVLILTMIPPNVKVGRAVIDRCCLLISEKLAEADDMALTAAHCAKTIIAASVSGNPVLRQCSRLLLPGMVEYVAKVAAQQGDGASGQDHLAALGEVLKAFGGLFTSIAEDLRVRVLGILLPVMTLLLDPTQETPSSLHSQALHQLLSFASASPSAFKDATAKLDTPHARAVGGLRAAGAECQGTDRRPVVE